LCREAGIPLVVHENFRFQPWYRAIKRLIDDGALGDIYQTTFRLRPGDGQGANAYLDRQPYFQKMPRFLVHETAVHFIDTFRFLMGEPDWVWADLRRLNPAIMGEDAGIIIFGFNNGRRAVFDGNRLVDHAATDQRRTMGEARIEGSKAVINLSGDGEVSSRKVGTQAVEDIDIGTLDATFGGGCVGRLQAHVVDHLIDATPLENEAEDYVRNLAIVEAVYASARQGTRVTLEPTDRQTGRST
ncbi:MAG: Gfo/Idh/MocA family oxidoreductase, partial [Pseudomonadota bacterium]